MRAGLVGYVTTKSSVLLKSIPDEVLENAEVSFNSVKQIIKSNFLIFYFNQKFIKFLANYSQ